MQRRQFVLLAGGTLATAVGAAYLLSDRYNFGRADLPADPVSPALLPDEERILSLASLAPSGHNTQPWRVQVLAPFHWILGQDRSRWLAAVDPHQRETLLSLGAFWQNLEIAARSLGYTVQSTLLAQTPQDERVLDLRLVKAASWTATPVTTLESRRTLRGDFSSNVLAQDDVRHLLGDESPYVHYLPRQSRGADLLNTQTVEANVLQAARDPAQQELADWIRFSSTEARSTRDGLTTGGMEIEGLTGWYVRNFYAKSAVLTKDFRERGIAQVRAQVAASGGWIVITRADGSVASLLETGRRMQRIFLKVRERKIGLHPMTQILEEPSTRQALPDALGLGENIQFLLRVGYVTDYPPPVSLRRPVAWFVQTDRR